MIFDYKGQVSNAQAITANTASTNVLDLGPIKSGIVRDIGNGDEVPFLIQVVEAFNNLTNLKVEVQVSDSETFASGVVTVWEKTVLLAGGLQTLGYKFNNDDIEPGANKRYLRVYYTVTGTAPTTGKITAGVVMAVPSNG